MGISLPLLALLHRVMRLGAFLSLGLVREGEAWASALSLTDLILSVYTEACSVLGNTRMSRKMTSRQCQAWVSFLSFAATLGIGLWVSPGTWHQGLALCVI